MRLLLQNALHLQVAGNRAGDASCTSTHFYKTETYRRYRPRKALKRSILGRRAFERCHSGVVDDRVEKVLILPMNIAAALVYWVIVGIWSSIFITAATFYVTNGRAFGTTKLLLAVLALDALRNVVENIYFGLYFGAKFGLFKSAIGLYLGDPYRLILPKLCNIAAGCIVLGLLLLRWLPAAIRERTEAEAQRKALNKLAATDGMTGLQNRRDFMLHAEAEWLRRERYNRELSLVILDIDNFKSINDDFGHAVGDEVIIGVAKLCQATKRDSDIAGRLGGEEFAILLPETGFEAAAAFAERLREIVARDAPRPQAQDAPGPQARGAPCASETATRMTVSIGVSTANNAASLSELFKQADEALYTAKHAGRNLVRCFVVPALN